MSPGVVVVTGEGLDAAAAHEAATFGQGMTAQQQRELERAMEQSTREQVQRAVAIAQEAARNVRASQLAQVPPAPQVPAAPPIPQSPPVTGVVVTPDGRRIVIGDARHPVATVTGRGDRQDVQFYAPNVPPEIVIIAVSFFIMLIFVAVGMPLARAYARRMDRQGVRAESSHFPTDVSDRIERIEQAVEAIAIEVERVSEGQRFTTKLLSELKAPAVLAAASSQYTGEKQ
jgi:hypothetical protein